MPWRTWQPMPVFLPWKSHRLPTSHGNARVRQYLTTKEHPAYFQCSYNWEVKVKLLVAQSSPTLCNTMDCSPPDSSVHGFSQARILEWVAFPVSRGSSWPRIELRSPALQMDPLPSEPPGKSNPAPNQSDFPKDVEVWTLTWMSTELGMHSSHPWAELYVRPGTRGVGLFMLHPVHLKTQICDGYRINALTNRARAWQL